MSPSKCVIQFEEINHQVGFHVGFQSQLELMIFRTKMLKCFQEKRTSNHKTILIQSIVESLQTMVEGLGRSKCTMSFQNVTLPQAHSLVSLNRYLDQCTHSYTIKALFLNRSPLLEMSVYTSTRPFGADRSSPRHSAQLSSSGASRFGYRPASAAQPLRLLWCHTVHHHCLHTRCSLHPGETNRRQ